MCNKTDDDNDDDDEFCRRAKKRMGRFANDTTLFTNELHILRVRKNRPFFITLVNTVRFLSRVSTLTRDIDIAIVSVRLSVRDVPVSDENGLTHRHSFFHRTVAQSF